MQVVYKVIYEWDVILLCLAHPQMSIQDAECDNDVGFEFFYLLLDLFVMEIQDGRIIKTCYYLFIIIIFPEIFMIYNMDLVPFQCHPVHQVMLLVRASFYPVGFLEDEEVHGELAP